MKKIFLGVCGLVLFAGIGIGMAGGTASATRSVMLEAPQYKDGEQCVFLNKANQKFYREILTLPADVCVIKIGSWIIKSDYTFRPVEVISPLKEQWWVIWKDLDLPVVDGKEWNFRLKIRGTNKVVAVVDYKFK